MDYQTFKDKLKECKLTIKEFANITGLNEKSISGNWKKANEVPKWVKPFIDNYIKAKTLENVKDVICNSSKSN